MTLLLGGIFVCSFLVLFISVNMFGNEVLM